MGLFSFKQDKYTMPKNMTPKEYAKIVISDAKEYSKDLNESESVFCFSWSYQKMIECFDILIWLNESKHVVMYPAPRGEKKNVERTMPNAIDSFIERSVGGITSTGEDRAFDLRFFIDTMQNDQDFATLLTAQNRRTIAKIEAEIKSIENEIRTNEIQKQLSSAGLERNMDFGSINELETISALEKNIESLYQAFLIGGHSSESGKKMFSEFKSNCESSSFPLAVEIRLESLLLDYEAKFSEESVLHRIDNMDGHSFELWCAGLLQNNGFHNVEVTPGSGDYGVDVLAEKDGIYYAIQCKCYSHDIGNAPVQEVYAGKEMYRCQVGAVMTNRYFTAGAKQLAEKTRVLLWDRDKLHSLAMSAE